MGSSVIDLFSSKLGFKIPKSSSVSIYNNIEHFTNIAQLKQYVPLKIKPVSKIFIITDPSGIVLDVLIYQDKR